jgi:hypothetical protein
MALVLTAGPAVEPVTLAEARAHLRVDGSAEDTLISSLIITSRLHVEAALGRRSVSPSSRRAGRTFSTPGRPPVRMSACRCALCRASPPCSSMGLTNPSRR